MKCLVLVLALSTAGCATSTRHVLVLADTALYEALSSIHSEEQTQLCGQPSCAGVTVRVSPRWTDEQSQEFNRRLLPGAQAGREFNSILASWVPGNPMPDSLQILIVSLGSSLSAVTASFPESPTKTSILAGIAKAQSIVLSALSLFTSVGSGAPVTRVEYSATGGK